MISSIIYLCIEADCVQFCNHVHLTTESNFSNFPNFVRASEENTSRAARMSIPPTRKNLLEKREHEHRKREFAREDMLKSVHNEGMMRNNLTSDERVENTRRLREQKERQGEIDLQRQLEDDEKQRQEKILLIQCEEKQLAQLEQKQHNALREEKIRQSIRENSLELRELEQRLNHAYTNKERTSQIQERLLREQREKVRTAAVRERGKLHMQCRAWRLSVRRNENRICARQNNRRKWLSTARPKKVANTRLLCKASSGSRSSSVLLNTSSFFAKKRWLTISFARSWRTTSGISKLGTTLYF